MKPTLFALLVATVGCAVPRPRVVPQVKANETVVAQGPQGVVYGINDGGYTGVPSNVADRYCAMQGPVEVRSAVLTAQQLGVIVASERRCPAIRAHVLIEQDRLDVADAIAPLSQDVSDVECGNELELAPRKLDITRAAAFVGQCAQHLRQRGFQGRILTAAIYTVDDQELRRLRAYHAACPTCDCAIHWYGDNFGAWVPALKAIGCPGFAITETGMPSKTPADDQGQLAYIQEQLPMFWQLGVRLIEGYQRLSGPTSSDLDNFGWDRFDGTQKPVWQLWTTLVERSR